jgi:hypothetical protein
MRTRLTGWQRLGVTVTVIFVLVLVIIFLRNLDAHYESLKEFGDSPTTLGQALVSNLADFIKLLLIPVVGWGVYWIWRWFRGAKAKDG